eukprot:1494390-Rhodomonas_salina.4
MKGAGNPLPGGASWPALGSTTSTSFVPTHNMLFTSVIQAEWLSDDWHRGSPLSSWTTLTHCQS